MSKKYWEIHGEFFGYPDCCVEFFSSLQPRSEAWYEKYDRSVFFETDFIPCPACLDGDHNAVLAHIAAHRNQCLAPFPDGRWLGNRSSVNSPQIRIVDYISILPKRPITPEEEEMYQRMFKNIRTLRFNAKHKARES